MRDLTVCIPNKISSKLNFSMTTIGYYSYTKRYIQFKFKWPKEDNNAFIRKNTKM
jgi:hypothetical protein